ncbi:MotE family protein [Roseibium sp. RKSG952]|uniref:MotE family protein n=1 Tax=Roseibium sp. RKSG952 TaxID=2529384 RepID=UPI0012BD6BA2|nr:hypothetical protein [Roseibium sp. RKSG952]MTI01301.1 hypothetical protein [Roseibium sp. RKSG952]
MRRNRKGKLGRQRSGVLTLISALMIGSAVIRLSLEAGPALARSDQPGSTSQPQSQQSGFEEQELQVVLTELLRREEAIERREKIVEDREKALEIADLAIAGRLITLREAEDALRATVAVADNAAEADLTRLTDVYQNMKPKDAAALFETMDPIFAAGFMSRMPPDTAAGVMAGLNPEAAYTISVVMAGRNALAPKE